MRVLAVEMDILLPYPELRWWVFGGALALLLGGLGIFWIVRRATRS